MSVKEPWSESWKTNCRSRIRGCEGVIAIVTTNTKNAEGQLWEIKVAQQVRIPIIGVYATTDNRPGRLPSELDDVRVFGWTWANIENFMDRV